ncbi:GxGYxYP domain-containing protein [Tengunoibacter tsumagoiensis]|uniref:GxGYxYP putative glycoside hydrolase N-terminal domain-containing protein n=1 Tax=Tengunoibacter tsumagoiensis TaxID=2014871 RepID=A0A402AAF1_9CHLR|nr:GxGYxYP domain-containing protein [Tengunoibacter tsumagoiensis]GCE16016.1 hypothetical protein KTT_58750 [Tengunoibacter tsumagoiensis]
MVHFLLWPQIAQASHAPTSQSLMSWPTSRLFPHFCCLNSLKVITLTKLPADQRTLFVSLQGLLNRQQTRIYVREDEFGGSSDFWLTQLHVPYSNVADPFSLFTTYHDEISGLIVTDPQQPATINLATTLAGQRNALIVSPHLLQQRMRLFHLPVLMDLRLFHFSSAFMVYQYAYKHYWSLSNHHLLVGLSPWEAGHLRDYAIATHAMVIWLDPGDLLQRILLHSFFAAMPAGSSYLGWWKNEPAGIRSASSYGIATYATDLASNLTVLGATSLVRQRFFLSSPLRLQRKIYISLFMSDGDNIQIDQHRLVQKWNDPERGRIPLGWTLSPALVDLAPVILNYYRETATINDDLVAGPSGMGYLYPHLLTNHALTTYMLQSRWYLAEAGFSIATIWENIATFPTSVGQAYAHYTDLQGITVQNTISISQSTPIIYNHKLAAYPLQGAYLASATEVEALIQQVATTDTNLAPHFLAIQVDLNKPGITPTSLYRVLQHFRSNDQIVFVRPSQFFQLFKASLL